MPVIAQRLRQTAARFRPARIKTRHLTTAAGLVAALLFCLFIASHRITLVVDGRAWQVRTLRGTAAAALKAAHVNVRPGDRVVPAPDHPLASGDVITVIRARPIRVITADGEQTVLSAAGTAAGLISDGGLALAGEYRAKVRIDAKRPDLLSVELVRIRTEIVTAEVTIPYRTERRETPTLELGIENDIQKGVAGLKEVQYRDTYENNKRVKREVISEKIIREPVTRLVAVGTAGTVTTRGGQVIRFKKAFLMTATGYTAGPESTGKYATGYTYLGMKASYGVVAVDPKVIPLRSRLYIEGYGYAVAGDIGGAIKGNRIDLCFDTVAEALDWGKRKVKVYIIE
ncbi:MAG: G5 domain-containing protein [Chloroflexota bacterium]